MKIVPTSVEYFKEAFDSARKKTGLSVEEDTEYYIVNMLTEFVDAEKFLRLYRMPVTYMVKKALENPRETLALSKDIGDITSFMCGFFPEHLEKDIIGYYMSIGERSYWVASGLDRRRAGIFSEMYDKFPYIVDTLNEIKESKDVYSKQDIDDMYNKWFRTGSKRLKKKLEENGIIFASESPLIH